MFGTFVTLPIIRFHAKAESFDLISMLENNQLRSKSKIHSGQLLIGLSRKDERKECTMEAPNLMPQYNKRGLYWEIL